MKLCYVDESGKAEMLVRADTKQQPVVVIGGVAFPEECLTEITHDWIGLKRRHFPGHLPRGQKGWLDAILDDVKGARLRRGFKRSGTGRQRKHAVSLVDGTLRLLEKHQGQIIARVWVKGLNQPNEDMRMHSSSLQFICAAFHACLDSDERGMVVVDSQTYQHNFRLAHSMFTQRFGKKSPHERLVDMPVFGHSDNHAGLQIADLLCSAVLAPIACAVYCGNYQSWNIHCDSGFLDIREQFGDRLRARTFDWFNHKIGKQSSSVVVNDPISKRPSRLMWGVSRKKAPAPKKDGRRRTRRPRTARKRRLRASK